MQIAPTTSGIQPQTRGPAQSAQTGFRQLLTGAPGQTAARNAGDEQKLRQAAQQLVSSALLKPLFEQMRSSPFRVERFHGGQGEKAFMQQLHTVLADRVTASSNFKVVDAIYDKMVDQYRASQKSSGDTAEQTTGQGLNLHG
jgi:hypothetical protein